MDAKYKFKKKTQLQSHLCTYNTNKKGFFKKTNYRHININYYLTWHQYTPYLCIFLSKANVLLSQSFGSGANTSPSTNRWPFFSPAKINYNKYALISLLFPKSFIFCRIYRHTYHFYCGLAFLKGYDPSRFQQCCKQIPAFFFFFLTKVELKLRSQIPWAELP